jgi:cation diffusion facilitator family transporter
MHVIADALTSVLAIVAIAGSALLHWRWLDPAVAIVGALIILQWCAQLLSETGRQLVDLDPSTASRDAVRAALEQLPGTRVCDLHLWRVGPGKLVCVVAVLVKDARPLDDYKRAVYAAVPVEHLTVEVRPA